MRRTNTVLTRLRRACFGAAAILVGAAVIAPVMAKAANDPDADRPVVWSGQASASAIIATVDSKNGVLPVQKPFFASIPDAASAWDTDSQYARASTYYPGPTGTAALNLICDEVLSQAFAPGRLPPNLDDPACNPAPKFPTVVEASSTTPDARSDGSQVIGSNAPITITTTSAVAHADRNSDYSDAVIGSMNVVGTPALGPAALAFRRQSTAILHGPAAAAAVTPQASDNSTLHIDSAVAHTKQMYDTDGALLVTASSTLKGVSLAGGAIQIGAIASDTTSRTDGRGIAEHSEHFTLSGVTVAGQPASIDQTGVHVGGSSTSAQPLTDALNAALAGMGAKVTLASTNGDVQSSDPKSADSEVQGLTFYIEQLLPIPNATDTYFATFTLGVAGTTATASNDRNGQAPANDTPIGGVTVPPDQSSSGTPPSDVPASFTPGTPGTPASSFNSPAKPKARSSVLGRRGVLDQLEADLAGFPMAHRFDLLYLAFAFAFVGVCLSSRLLVPRPRRVS
jgi:hypothetical protein